MENTPIIPGRGLISASAIQMRHQYLQALGHEIGEIADHRLVPSSIQNNIESFIGSVEIPVGIVGPLRFGLGEDAELVHGVVGTLEGALVASMNRGAKAISHAGGFRSAVIHQKMVRAPLFLFEHLGQALQFETWVKQHFRRVKEVAEKYSNHAKLQEVQPVLTGRDVHLKFVYQTGDAAGQNMTTTCTWHAILWVAEHFQAETGLPIQQFVIEGNGASDKKASAYSMQHGRGIRVVAECTLPEAVIQRVLRTSSEAILRCFSPSIALSKLDGMLGYNINVANAVAAIFVATGQDLGSVHESSLGVLNVEKAADGLHFSLLLPSLVIGTVGGGTHLPKQKEALQLMGCYGSGKVERFAQLIAGFALALEISTYAAIVSGEFAKAHEKLGRNKPVNHLLKAEITTAFIQKCLVGSAHGRQLLSAEIHADELVENGIIIAITGRVSRKLIGFIPLTLHFLGAETQEVIIKSKALDLEVIKGLHAMAASIDPALSDLFSEFKDHLEYAHCHLKEILLYEQIAASGIGCTPVFYGKYVNEKREIYLFVQEMLHPDGLLHINSQKQPERWSPDQITATIEAITAVHQNFQQPSAQAKLPEVKRFEPWQAAPLYRKLVAIMRQEEDDPGMEAKVAQMLGFVEQLQAEREALSLPETIIHNDFNSRNIAIRRNGQPCIYDWELAVVNLPHRDVVEFLSFVLPEGFDKGVLLEKLHHHFGLWKDKLPDTTWAQWKRGYVYAIKEYLVTRVSFYEVAGILAKYAFSARILRNSFRMLEMLLDEPDEPHAD